MIWRRLAGDAADTIGVLDRRRTIPGVGRWAPLSHHVDGAGLLTRAGLLQELCDLRVGDQLGAQRLGTRGEANLRRSALP